MKPLDTAPDRQPAEATGKPDRTPTGKSGEGAASALEQIIRQEKARVLHNPAAPPGECAN